VNIQIDHMPIRRAIDGSSEGSTRLNDSRPPATTESQAWTLKIWYRVDPLKAEFLPVAPEARGAKVVAAERARRATWCVEWSGVEGKRERIEDREKRLSFFFFFLFIFFFVRRRRPSWSSSTI
jgi:hypothetical protein